MALTLNQLTGLAYNASPNSTSSETVGRAYDSYNARFTDIGTAANGQTIETIVKLDATQYPNGARLVAAYVAPGIAVTAHDTNYKEVTFHKLTSAGGSTTTIASWTTKITGGSGNLVANQSSAATVTTTSDANILAAGSIIAYTVSGAAGTGVAMNANTAVTKGHSKVTIVLQAL